MTSQSQNALVARCLRETAEVIKPYQLSCDGLPLYVALNCRANDLEAAEEPEEHIPGRAYELPVPWSYSRKSIMFAGAMGVWSAQAYESNTHWCLMPEIPPVTKSEQKPEPVDKLSEEDLVWIEERAMALDKRVTSHMDDLIDIAKEALLRGRNSPQGASKP